MLKLIIIARSLGHLALIFDNRVVTAQGIRINSISSHDLGQGVTNVSS
jgi:hypothetical protein